MFSIKNTSINLQDIEKYLVQLSPLLQSCHKIQLDSRLINAGDVFCAYPGVLSDGRDFLADAIARGASAIIYEAASSQHYPVHNNQVPCYAVHNLIDIIGILIAHKAKYHRSTIIPASPYNPYIVGITGTNGKTTVTQWLAQACSWLEHTVSVVSTVGNGIYPHLMPATHTTPDPCVLHNLLAATVDVVALEVSSHALIQGRVNGIIFDTAVFTNLSHDHLDYHHTMTAYFAAKESLFFWHNLQYAVVNSDDQYGKQLLYNLVQDHSIIQIISYGINSGMLRATNIEYFDSSVQFILSFQNKTQLIQLYSIATINIYNALAVFGVLLAKDESIWQNLAPLAAALTIVAGRMQTFTLPITNADPARVVIDYAHTPAALEQTLLALRASIKQHGKLSCVFGCGGNRDSYKRSIMGCIATKYADRVIVTTDNPRDEDPQEIARDITQKLHHQQYIIVLDRADAIRYALSQARADDIILVAGKGHEQYQDIKGIKYSFSDADIVKDYIDNIIPLYT